MDRERRERPKRIGIIAAALICLLATALAGTAVAVWGIQKYFHSEVGLGWQTPQIQESVLSASERMAEICKRVEAELEGEELRINTMLYDPQSYEEIWGELEKILQLERQALTEEEQFMYDCLAYCCEQCRRRKELPDYTPLLSGVTGVLNRVPEVFYTYDFSSQKAVEDYFKYLEQAPGFFLEMSGRLSVQSAEGVRYRGDLVREQIMLCDKLLGEDSIFLVSFSYRIDACDFLKEEQKESFRRKNRAIVQGPVADALKQLKEALEKLEDHGEGAGLCSLKEGLDFYEYLLEVNTGSGLSAREMYRYLEEKKQVLLAEMEDTDYEDKKGGILIRGKTGREILEQLEEYGETGYPRIEKNGCRIERIPDFLGSTLYSGFYTRGLQGTDNCIYLNPSLTEGTELYQVLAHEAIPGHMYYYNYKREDKGYPFLSAQINCLGYSEGWASYAEIAAGEWLGEDSAAYCRAVRKKLFDQLVMCQADIGINGLGWEKEELGRYLADCYGEQAAKQTDEVWKTLIQNPAGYEPYVVGYFQMKDLEAYAGEYLGMETQEFLEHFLQIGQAPFPVVREHLRVCQMAR